MKTYKNADQALKIDNTLKENFGDFVCFTNSINNTWRDSLDWMYWCRGNNSTYHDNPEECLDNISIEPMDVSGYVKKKDEIVKVKTDMVIGNYFFSK